MKKAVYNCISMETLPNDITTGSLGKAKRMCKRPKFRCFPRQQNELYTSFSAFASFLKNIFKVVGQDVCSHGPLHTSGLNALIEGA
jgi:hypothetical protein